MFEHSSAGKIEFLSYRSGLLGIEARPVPNGLVTGPAVEGLVTVRGGRHPVALVVGEGEVGPPVDVHLNEVKEYILSFNLYIYLYSSEYNSGKFC